ncbi:MAG: SRPBCC family protein [Thiohalomonadaceae bacterium]
MGHDIVTQIVINAPAERLWRTLCDFPSYPAWNPFLREVSGTPGQGEHLIITHHLPGSRPWRERTRITRIHEEREIAWFGHRIFPGILDGEHAFLLIPLDDRRTQVVQRKRYSGLLCAFAWPSIRTRMRRGLMMTNAALKAHAEERQQQHA